MRAYLQLFFGLLVPLSALFMLVAVIYFQLEYNFTKSMRLGVLLGFFVAIAVSFFIAYFLLIMRRGKNISKDKDIFKRSTKHKLTVKDVKKTSNDKKEIKKEIITDKVENTTIQKTTREEKLMLLMDKELAYEVTIHAIKNQNIGKLKTDKSKEFHSIHVQNDDKIIDVNISSLTKHTAHITITSIGYFDIIDKVIFYLKEKEQSFLQY